MSPRPTILNASLLTFALILSAPAAASTAEEGMAYGMPLTGTDTVEISVLIDRPDQYLDKTVRVSGRVTGVCEKAGCWMTLAAGEGRDDFRIKVDDGVIVFPVSAVGRQAVAEGRFTRIRMTLDQTRRYREHLAEEQGEKFDPDSVTEPLTYYQVNATGAVIR